MSDDLDSIVTDKAYIVDLFFRQAEQEPAHSWSVNLNADKTTLRFGFGHRQQRVPVSKADLQNPLFAVGEMVIDPDGVLTQRETKTWPELI